MKLVRKKIEGIPMWLDIEDRGVGQRLNAKGGREYAFMWILRNEASGLAFDVGANIGYCTLSLAKVCDTVVAFEPDPRSHKVLMRNCVDMSNVAILDCAVGEKRGTTSFALADKPNLSGVGKHIEGQRVNVSARSIDDYPVKPSFIKMDIEGGEVAALKGAAKTLEEAEKMKILIEVHPQYYSAENDFAEQLRHLFKLGYEAKYVVNAKDRIDAFAHHPDTVCVKKLKQYPARAVWAKLPQEKVVEWATTMPEDGKKYIRALLLEKA